MRTELFIQLERDIIDLSTQMKGIYQNPNWQAIARELKSLSRYLRDDSKLYRTEDRFNIRIDAHVPANQGKSGKLVRNLIDRFFQKRVPAIQITTPAIRRVMEKYNNMSREDRILEIINRRESISAMSNVIGQLRSSDQGNTLASAKAILKAMVEVEYQFYLEGVVGGDVQQGTEILYELLRRHPLVYFYLKVYHHLNQHGKGGERNPLTTHLYGFDYAVHRQLHSRLSDTINQSLRILTKESTPPILEQYAWFTPKNKFGVKYSISSYLYENIKPEEEASYLHSKVSHAFGAILVDFLRNANHKEQEDQINYAMRCALRLKDLEEF